MKKIMLFMALCAATAITQGMRVPMPFSQKNPQDGMHYSDGKTLDQHQQECKKKFLGLPSIVLLSQMHFSNGKTLSNLRQELKERFPNMPPMIVSHWYDDRLNPHYARPNQENYFYDEATDTAENYPDGVIIMPNNILKFDYDTVKFALMHEIGHSAMPYNLFIINTINSYGFLPIAYFWKKLGSKNYKNCFTKFGSKSIAGLLVSGGIGTILRNLEERRADNFACAHSDINELYGGQQWMQSLIDCEKDNDQWIPNSYWQNLFYAKYQKALYPPSSSRLAKMKRWIMNKTNPTPRVDHKDIGPC